MKSSEKQLAQTLVETLENASKEDIEQTTTAVIHLLASRNELNRLKGLIEAIEQVWIQKYGAATITVETPYPLSIALRKKFETIAQQIQLKKKKPP